MEETKQQETGTNRDAIEVPLIHKIAENWGKPGYPLPVMVGWVREYGRTYHVMESQDLLRDRNNWKEKAVGMLQQVEAEEAKNRKASSVLTYNETRIANQATVITDLQKTELELRQLLRRVLLGEPAALKEGLELLKIDQMDALSNLRKNRDNAAKEMFAASSPALNFLRNIVFEAEAPKPKAPSVNASIAEIFLKVLNSMEDKPKENDPRLKPLYEVQSDEITKLKKDLQLKDIELQEALHKIKRIQESKPISTWETNYKNCLAELKTAKEVNSQHIGDYNIQGEKLRATEEELKIKDQQMEELGNKLKESFPAYVMARKCPDGFHDFELNLSGLEKDFKALIGRPVYNPHSSIGMLTPFMVHSGTSMWNAENKPANEDYRELYHKSEANLLAVKQYLARCITERDNLKGAIAQLNTIVASRDRLIADKNKVIQAMKSSTVNEGWLDPAASKNLKDQARMWKHRCQKLSEGVVDNSFTVESFANAPVGAYAPLADYKARIKEINALHRNMEDVYHLIKAYIPIDHNIDYWEKGIGK